MMDLTLIIAAGIIAFLLLYIARILDEKEHFAFRFLAISFAIILFVIIAKGSIDATTTCESVINQTIEDTVLNTTTHTYMTQCYSNTDSTTSTVLYKFIMGILVVYFLYVLGFFIWKGSSQIMDWVKRR